MRLLGHGASLAAFRWDCVYLLARLLADDRQDVKALGAAAKDMLDQVGQERAALEAVEDNAVIASALLGNADKARDKVLIAMGGVARAMDKPTYAVLFPKLNPSRTARLTVAEESTEIARILAELAKLPADHALRVGYESELAGAESATKTAAAQQNQAAVALSIQRSQMGRFKLGIDKGRLEIHGHLVALLKDKADADSFFRPTSSSPGEEEKKEPAAPAAPPVPANP